MKTLLVKYGEIALRGKNRHKFENTLIDTLQKNLRGGYKISKEQGRILIENPDGVSSAATKVKSIIGVTYLCPCLMLKDQSIENLKENVVKHLEGKNNFTFKIITKRGNKNYPLNSMEINAVLGEHVLENFEAKVDVKTPQITIYVELRNNAYIYTEIIKGVGGLPFGGGKALALLSGGIDSPVAAFLTARRGVEISGIYFHASPYTSERARQKVEDIVKLLKVYTGKLTLYVVNFTPLQVFLNESIPNDLLTIFLKRAMLRVSQKIARRINAQALVMGDSIGQVASQTIFSMQAIDTATSMTIIRPLATYDKQDIVNLAVELETYPISILPYEDCCTIFVPKHPVTKPNLELIENIESKIIEQITEMVEKIEYETVRV